MLSALSNMEVNIRWLLSYILKKYYFNQKPAAVEDLETIYKSANFLVINKQCDIAINSNTPLEHPVTVATQLNHHYPQLSDPSVMYGFRFCHRLDFSTSGVLCLALHKDAAAYFAEALQSRTVEKYYLALVYGHISQEFLTINHAVGKDNRPEFSHKMCTDLKEYCTHARWAVSRLLVLQRGLYNNYPATKVLLKLLTGRRHQLRVHCHELGHTIIGDYTYSDRKDLTPYRMFLHAYRFILPTNIERLDVCTEDPFTENDPRNKWLPVETINILNEDTFKKISRTDL